MLRTYARNAALVTTMSLTAILCLPAHVQSAARNEVQWELGRGIVNNEKTQKYDVFLLPGWSPHIINEKYHRGLNLYNQKNGKALIYQKPRASNLLSPTTKTVSLGWLSRKEARSNRARQPFTFHRKGTSLAPLRYGELIAIHVLDPIAHPNEGGFLTHKKRDYGINLGFDRGGFPRYEWKIVGGPDGAEIRHQGAPDRTRPVALFNTAANDFLVHCKRKWGIDLRWAKDCK